MMEGIQVVISWTISEFRNLCAFGVMLTVMVFCSISIFQSLFPRVFQSMTTKENIEGSLFATVMTYLVYMVVCILSYMI